MTKHEEILKDPTFQAMIQIMFKVITETVTTEQLAEIKQKLAREYLLAMQGVAAINEKTQN